MQTGRSKVLSLSFLLTITFSLTGTQVNAQSAPEQPLEIDGKRFSAPPGWTPPTQLIFSALKPKEVSVFGRDKNLKDFTAWSPEEQLEYVTSIPITSHGTPLTGPLTKPGSSSTDTPAADQPLDISVPPVLPTISGPTPPNDGVSTQAEWDAVHTSPMAGKLITERADGSGSACSASLVNAQNGGTLITAAHCFSAADQYAYYIPNYDNGRAPLGVWYLWTALVSNCWGGGNLNCDYAYGLIPRQSNGYGIQDFTGANGISFGYEALSGRIDAIGYPVNPKPRFNGEYQWRCGAPVGTIPLNHDRWHYADECRMAQGSSGGPWISGYSSSVRGGTITGVTSWVTCIDPSCTTMTSGIHSPRLLSNAGADFAYARTLTRPA